MPSFAHVTGLKKRELVRVWTGQRMSNKTDKACSLCWTKTDKACNQLREQNEGDSTKCVGSFLSFLARTGYAKADEIQLLSAVKTAFRGTQVSKFFFLSTEALSRFCYIPKTFVLAQWWPNTNKMLLSVVLVYVFCTFYSCVLSPHKWLAIFEKPTWKCSTALYAQAQTIPYAQNCVLLLMVRRSNALYAEAQTILYAQNCVLLLIVQKWPHDCSFWNRAK